MLACSTLRVTLLPWVLPSGQHMRAPLAYPSAPSPLLQPPVLTPPWPRRHAPFALTNPPATVGPNPKSQNLPPFPSVLCTSAARSMIFQSSHAVPREPGTTSSTPAASVSTKLSASANQETLSAVSGRKTSVAPKSTTSRLNTSAQDVLRLCTELAAALEHRKLHPLTPYKAGAWKLALNQVTFLERINTLLSSLLLGFIVGFPIITHVQSPPNSTSISTYQREFNEIIHKEIMKGRYIGPYPFLVIEEVLGPY